MPRYSRYLLPPIERAYISTLSPTELKKSSRSKEAASTPLASRQTSPRPTESYISSTKSSESPSKPFLTSSAQIRCSSTTFRNQQLRFLTLYHRYSDTFFLGQRDGFNSRLNDTRLKFTYFVPRDKAWRKAEIDNPSTLKKLFMPEFSYHVRGFVGVEVFV